MPVVKIWPQPAPRAHRIWGFGEGDNWSFSLASVYDRNDVFMLYMPKKVTGKGSRTHCIACLQCKTYIQQDAGLGHKVYISGYSAFPALDAFQKRHQFCTTRMEKEGVAPVDVVTVVRLSYTPEGFDSEFSPLELLGLTYRMWKP